MVLKDMFHNVKLETALDDQNMKTTTQQAAGTDLAGFAGALIVYSVGTAGDTWSGTVKVKLDVYEADTLGGAYTLAANGDLIHPLAEWIIKTGKEKLFWAISYVGSKTFIKAQVTLAGTHTNGTDFAAVIIKGFPTHAPAV